MLFFQLFPLDYKMFCPWEACSPNGPWSFSAYRTPIDIELMGLPGTFHTISCSDAKHHRNCFGVIYASALCYCPISMLKFVHLSLCYLLAPYVLSCTWLCVMCEDVKKQTINCDEYQRSINVGSKVLNEHDDELRQPKKNNCSNFIVC